jgi:hypothetical protein
MWHQFAAQLNATELPGMIGINAARALAKKKQRKSIVIKVASPRKAVAEIRPSGIHEIALTELLGNLSARTVNSPRRSCCYAGDRLMEDGFEFRRTLFK